jgi:hypothetical protein
MGVGIGVARIERIRIPRRSRKAFEENHGYLYECARSEADRTIPMSGPKAPLAP